MCIVVENKALTCISIGVIQRDLQNLLLMNYYTVTTHYSHMTTLFFCTDIALTQ